MDFWRRLTFYLCACVCVCVIPHATGISRSFYPCRPPLFNAHTFSSRRNPNGASTFIWNEGNKILKSRKAAEDTMTGAGGGCLGCCTQVWLTSDFWGGFVDQLRWWHNASDFKTSDPHQGIRWGFFSFPVEAKFNTSKAVKRTVC